MKCDKLQQVENPIEWGLYYDKNEVEAAIAELKEIANDACLERDDNQKVIDELEAENQRLVKCCKEYDSRQRIDERIKANASKQLRATKRALWLARASSAKNKVRFFGWSFDCYNTTLLINIDGHKYKMPKQSRMITCHDWIEIFERVEERCRQKADAYK